MRRRIFWAMVAVVVVTLVLGGLTAAFLIGRQVEEARVDEFRRQAEAAGRLIEAEIESQRGVIRQVVGLQRVLEVARTIGGHDFVDGVFVGPGGPEVFGREADLIGALPGEALADGGEGEYRVDVAGTETLAVVRHIDVARGRVIVAIGSGQVFVPWGGVVARLLLGLGAGVVMAAVLAGRLARSTGRQLDGLAAAADAIADGDLSARAPVTGDDEVAAVSAAFNDMVVQLEESQERERDFLMSVGHDLRTPLTTIRGYAEALASGDLDPEDLPRVAGVLETQSGRLGRLVEDIMLLSRLEARQFTLRPEPVDVAAHLKEVVEAFRHRAEGAGVRLASEIEPVGLLDLDPDRLAQVATNLIENALRYTPEGGTMTVGLHPEEGRRVLQVADTGPGIDPEDLPYIFDRLYVAQRYQAIRPEGSGLGLNLVKELAVAMGAEVSAASTPGRGTTLTVTLPPTTAPPSP